MENYGDWCYGIATSGTLVLGSLDLIIPSANNPFWVSSATDAGLLLIPGSITTAFFMMLLLVN
jgi:hypothetical protein